MGWRVWAACLGALIGGVTLSAAANAGATARAHAALPCVPLLSCTAPTTTTTPATTPAPPPPPITDAGAWYDGHRRTELYASLRISSTGKRLEELVFVIHHGRCGAGKLYEAGVTLRPSSGASIGTDGRATYTHVARHSSFTTASGHHIHGVQRTKLSVGFTGASASGSVSVSFRSGGLRCSTGTIPFQAVREGSAAAPLSDSALGSGSYRGDLQQMDGNHLPFSMEVFLPWHVIELLRFKWQLDCPEHVYNERSTFEFIPLEGEPSDWSASGHGTVKYRHGIRAHWFYKLAGYGQGVLESPQWKGWRYNATGTWTYQVQYTRAGELLETCSQSGNYFGVGPKGWITGG